ncbi:MAG: HEAT repeat domain-containing protein [Anaerolineae bacterium]|nr:HEAT repeat domain-containing protein [Anaerolineae bacterium]
MSLITIAPEERQEKFARTLAILQDPAAPFTAEVIYILSDLMGEYLDQFRAVWPGLLVERRRQLIARLVDTAETNFELDFSTIIHPALDDADLEVRKNAVEGVLEDSPNRVIERLMKIAQDDPFSEVRAAAARALGQFVLKGELGKLPAALNIRLQDTVLALYRNTNEDLDVRRRALEAVGNCGREGVSDLIREAYYADEQPMRASAVFAMGRSCDDVWAPQVMDELISEHPEMRYEAARAAGELELRRALPRLAELAIAEEDTEIREMAIWALGEIGGDLANKVLTQLAALADETDDDELADAVAEAQGAASLAGEDVLPLFDFADLDALLDDDEDDILLESLDELADAEDEDDGYEDEDGDENEDEDDEY